MPGRRRLPGTDAQRAAARRQQVRENVRAYRLRNRERQRAGSGTGSSENPSNPESSRTSSAGSETVKLTHEDYYIQTTSHEVQVGREIIDNGVRWSLRLPFKISMGPSYTNAFISALQDRGVPESTDTASLSVQILSTPPNSSSSTIANDQSVVSSVAGGQPFTIHVEICCGKWITAITFQAMSAGSDMLKEALLAAALSLLSIEHKDERMRLQATQIQTQALRKLREGFDAYVNGVGLEKATLLAATAMTCSMSELLVNKSWEGFSLHLRGVGALIEHGGISSLSTDDAKANFYGYRAVQLPFLILERRSSFLSQPQWIHLPWGDDHPSAANSFQALNDIAFQLPPQIELYDINQPHSSDSLREQLKQLDEITLDLKAWRQNLWKEHSTSAFETQPTFWSGVPLGDLTTITFHNDAEASAFIAFTGIQITLFSLRRQVTQSLQESGEEPVLKLNEVTKQLLNWSRMACRCLDAIFSHGGVDTLKLVALFSFDRAWVTFLELDETGVEFDLKEELEWCNSMAVRLEETGLPILKKRA